MPTGTAITNYSGAGKVALNNSGTLLPMMPDGENGAIKIAFNFPRTKRMAAGQGYVVSTLNDSMAKINLTPFDSWSLLPTLFPAFLGVTTVSGTGAATGALVIGSRPHDKYANAANGCSPAVVWTIDGRSYRLVRTAVTKPPVLKLGVGMPLFSDTEITALTDPALALGAGGELIDEAAHTAGTAGTTGMVASGATDPASWIPDFINGHWTAAYGSSAGFGGDGGLAMDAEDGWELTPMIKYSPLTMQKRTMHIKLDSVEFQIKGRLQGPTHNELLALVGEYGLGAGVMNGAIGGAAVPLTLTGPNGKTITMPDCVPIFDNSGIELGGTKFNMGDVVFVSRYIPAGAPAIPPVLLQFSA